MAERRTPEEHVPERYRRRVEGSMLRRAADINGDKPNNVQRSVLEGIAAGVSQKSMNNIPIEGDRSPISAYSAKGGELEGVVKRIKNKELDYAIRDGLQVALGLQSALDDVVDREHRIIHIEYGEDGEESKPKEAKPDNRYIRINRDKFLGMGGMACVFAGTMGLHYESLKRIYSNMKAIQFAKDIGGELNFAEAIHNYKSGTIAINAELDEYRTLKAEGIKHYRLSPKDKASFIRDIVLEKVREGLGDSCQESFLQLEDGEVEVAIKYSRSTENEKEKYLVGLVEPFNIPVLAYERTKRNGAVLVLLKINNPMSFSQAYEQLDLRSAVTLMRDAAIGINGLHKHRVIHRDVKPENIILSKPKKGRVTPHISDQGMASIPDESSNLTITGTVKGTPRYMYPGQAFDTKRVGYKADIYSFGATVYKLITGNHFLTDSGSGDDMAQHLREWAQGRGYYQAIAPSVVSTIGDREYRETAYGRFGFGESKKRGRQRLKRMINGIETVIAGCTVIAPQKRVYILLKHDKERAEWQERLAKPGYESMEEVVDDLNRVINGEDPLVEDYRKKVYTYNVTENKSTLFSPVLFKPVSSTRRAAGVGVAGGCAAAGLIYHQKELTELFANVIGYLLK